MIKREHIVGILYYEDNTTAKFPLFDYCTLIFCWSKVLVIFIFVKSTKLVMFDVLIGNVEVALDVACLFNLFVTLSY